jgi:hypothetical protein
VTERATDPKWFNDISTARLQHEYKSVCDYISYWETEAQEMPVVSFKNDPFRPDQRLTILHMIRDEVGQELLARERPND